MGRQATKAVGNPYYEARIQAAKWDDRLASRAGAAEMMHVSEDVIKDAELGLYKCMPVDLVVRMADAYKAPELMNHYCLEQCPIGVNRPLSKEVPTIERVTVRLLKKLRVEQLMQIGDKLVDIANDGVVTDDEMIELKKVRDYLHELSKTISELELIVDRGVRREK